MGFFLAQNAKPASSNGTKNVTVLITVTTGSLSVDQLVADFTEMFDWGSWSAKSHGLKTFLMKFPSVARIDELRKSKSFELTGSGASVSVAKWTAETETTAKAKLHSLWIRATGVHEEMMHSLGLCEAGSMIGAVQEVDMDLCRNYDIARIKVGVKVLDM